MLTVISGTNRPQSKTRVVAGHVAGLLRGLGEETKLLDLAEMPATIFSPSAYAEKPEAFAPFREAVTGAAGLVVVTPEYNGSLPGVLKYFIDMLPFPESFERRPVCFVGLAAGQWGALRAVEHLQLIFGYRNAHIYPVRVFVPGIHGHVAEEGVLKSPEVERRLQDQAEGFVRFVRGLS